MTTETEICVENDITINNMKSIENFYKNYLQYNGHIYYHKSIDSTNKIANQLLDKINSESDLFDNKLIVGFDCEWKAFPRPSKVCLIQICVDSNECHLFHLSAMNYMFPTPLLSLISHPNFIKVGLNIEGDFWKLQRDYGLPLDDLLVGDHKSIVDLSVLANNLLGKTSKWSLSRLSEYLLKKPILKELQTSDWSVNPLSDGQQRYAAIDAFASYELYFEIKTNAMPFGYN